MHRVLLSASFPEESITRQTPGGSGQWDDIQYITQADDQPVSAWVVYDNLKQPISQVCPAENTLLITGEPECLRRYRSRFTSQFGQVWTAQPSIQHSLLTRQHEAQPWHYALHAGSVHGRPLGFDELRALRRPQKTKCLSVICSSKSDSEDHRRRLEFVRLLQRELGDHIDVFGRGIRSMEDKSEAIYDYKYHIVLENDHGEHFMTEKLADAFLGWSYPLYFGGPEAQRRFPTGSFTAINIYQPNEALAIIRQVVGGQVYEQSQDKIAAARETVLYKNNLFALLAEHWRRHLANDPPRPITLLPKNHRAGLVVRQMGRVLRGRPKRRAA